MALKFVLRSTVLSAKHCQTIVGLCVTCCGWALLSDNDVRVMTSSLTPTSPTSVREQSQKGEDVCEIRS